MNVKVRIIVGAVEVYLFITFTMTDQYRNPTSLLTEGEGGDGVSERLAVLQ